MKIRLSKLPRHASFEYRPRYYDPDKERHAKQRALDYGEGDVGETLKSRISDGFSRSGGSSQFSFRTQRAAQVSASNRRLVLIIAFMSLAAYLMLKSEGLERLLSALT